MASEQPISTSVLDGIGSTSLVELRHLGSSNHARILIKMESENPTGSMKDRMALAIIDAAERDGQLNPGGRVVEYTGGSTGVSLALICGLKGYRLDIVTSDAFSREKRDHMQALGAKLMLVNSIDGGMDAALTHAMIDAARRLRQNTGAFWVDQLNNADADVSCVLYLNTHQRGFQGGAFAFVDADAFLEEHPDAFESGDDAGASSDDEAPVPKKKKRKVKRNGKK